MNYNLLDTFGIIENKDMVFSRLRTYKNLKSYSDKQLCFMINDKARVAHYFDKNFVEVASEDRAQYMWVTSGLCTDSKETLYFHFSRRGNEWAGALVGTQTSILETQSKSIGHINVIWLDIEKNNTISKNTTVGNSSEDKGYDIEIDESFNKKSVDDDLYEVLLSNLLFKDKFSIRNMKYYINSLLQRLNYFIQNDIPVDDYVVYTQNKDYALINTGLLDKFGNTVNIITKVMSRNDLSYTMLDLVKCKTTLLNYGFTRESINKDIKPVRFWDKDNSELIFDANIEDFDLSGWNRLEHCIEERKERYPVEMQKMSSEVLCRDLVNAIQLGIKLSKYDTNYVLPTYNMKYNRLHYIIPYHLNNDFSKKPELGIVVAKTETFWQIMTILDRQQCEDAMFFLSLYTDTCFSDR